MLDRESIIVRRGKLAQEADKLRLQVTMLENKTAESLGALKQKEGALILCNELLAEMESPQPTEEQPHEQTS